MLVNKLNELRKGSEEEGFTLIELMIVVVIIGILAAIAIPIFANQQKEAIKAGIKSDVRNTVTNVATALASNPDANETELAAVAKVQTNDNTVVIGGDWDGYTVTGSNSGDLSGYSYVFTSSTGKYTEPAATV